MTFNSHDTKISLVYENKNDFMHEYYHSTTVKYSESAPKWVLPIWPPRLTSGFKSLNVDALSSLLYRSVDSHKTMLRTQLVFQVYTTPRKSTALWDSMFKLHYMILTSWLKSNDYAGYKYRVTASSRKHNRRNLETNGFHISLTRENKNINKKM